MKSLMLGSICCLLCLVAGCATDQNASTSEPASGKKLRHVVALKFRDGTSPAKTREIEEAFRALKQKIPQIAALEWGTNNSPENLNKGFTHCFTLTFRSEKDRADYLPHPDHAAFGKMLGPVLADVFVLDYWTQE